MAEIKILGDKKPRRYDEGLVDKVNKQFANEDASKQEQVVLPESSPIKIYSSGEPVKSLNEWIEFYNKKEEIMASLPDIYAGIKQLKSMIENKQDEEKAPLFLKELRSDASLLKLEENGNLFLERPAGIITSTLLTYPKGRPVWAEDYYKINKVEKKSHRMLATPMVFNGQLWDCAEGEISLSKLLKFDYSHDFLKRLLRTEDGKEEITSVLKFFAYNCEENDIRFKLPAQTFFSPLGLEKIATIDLYNIDMNRITLTIDLARSISNDKFMAWGVKE